MFTFTPRLAVDIADDDPHADTIRKALARTTARMARSDLWDLHDILAGEYDEAAAAILAQPTIDVAAWDAIEPQAVRITAVEALIEGLDRVIGD